MTIPSFKKCPKGHRKEYYHRTLGPEWCHWCPKCKRIYNMQNYYHWPVLSFIDNFVEAWCTPIGLYNRYRRFRWFLGAWIYGAKEIKNACRWCKRKYRMKGYKHAK